MQNQNEQIETPKFNPNEFGMSEKVKGEENAAPMEMPKYPILSIDEAKKSFVEQDGTAVGVTLKGTVVTPWNKIYTDKGKRKDEGDGRKYSDNIVLRSPNGKLFGIWLTGDMRSQAKKLIPGDFMRVTYLGRALEPRPGAEDRHHMFEFAFTDANGAAINLGARLA
jgi:hypothetical protein